MNTVIIAIALAVTCGTVYLYICDTTLFSLYKKLSGHTSKETAITLEKLGYSKSGAFFVRKFLHSDSRIKKGIACAEEQKQSRSDLLFTERHEESYYLNAEHINRSFMRYTDGILKPLPFFLLIILIWAVAYVMMSVVPLLSAFTEYSLTKKEDTLETTEYQSESLLDEQVSREQQAATDTQDDKSLAEETEQPDGNDIVAEQTEPTEETP